jgi:ABC-2 type transport system permease protein
MFINFFSGAYFTLALLPASILKVAMFMPFAYTFYVPTQIYLGKMSISEGWSGLLVSIVWLFVLYVIIKIIWKRGLKKYDSVGI